MHNEDIVYVELVLCYLAEAYAFASGPASGKQVPAIFQVIHSQTVRQSRAILSSLPAFSLRLLYSHTVCDLRDDSSPFLQQLQGFFNFLKSIKSFHNS